MNAGGVDERRATGFDAGMPNSKRVFSYAKCSTCRAALRFLESEGIGHSVHDITATPPSVDDLTEALAVLGDRRKLFNTSGQQYRELGVSEKLKSMTDAEAIRLLSGNGRLVKRPFVIWREGGRTRVLVGFKDVEWKRAFASPPGQVSTNR